MNQFDELHNLAMDCAERGEKLLKKSPKEAKEAYAEGLALELQALGLLGPTDALTLAVFTRSAAALALGAQNFAEARRLIGQGLQGAPPAIRAELEALRARIPGEPDPESLKARINDLPLNEDEKARLLAAIEPKNPKARFKPRHIAPPGEYKPLWQAKDAA